MQTDMPYPLPVVLLLVFSAALTLTIREREPLFLGFSPMDFFAYSFSFLILCFLCGLVIYFRQQSEPLSRDAPNPARPVSVDDAPGDGMPAAIQFPSHTNTFADSIEGDFYQAIIRNNLFAPLGTVLNAETDPGHTCYS